MKFIQDILRKLAGPLSADEVTWVVNDLGELGVRIAGTSYFLHKGGSIVYSSTHQDGTRMMQRVVGKREFGEACRLPWVEVGDGNATYFDGSGWFPLTEGKEPAIPHDFEDRFAAFLDAHTMTCPHGCGQTIRQTDEQAHHDYGCTVAEKIGRGPVAVAA